MTTPKILIGSNTMKMVTIMRIIDMYEKWVVKEKNRNPGKSMWKRKSRDKRSDDESEMQDAFSEHYEPSIKE
jgi:hypothetical protein